MAEAAKRPLPAAALEKTKQIILDTIAAMVSGAELPPGKFAINFARAYKGEKIATVVASNVLCGPIEQPWSTACWRTPMRPMTRIRLRSRIPERPSFPPRWPWASSSAPTGLASCASVALGYDKGPRVTATLGKLQYMAETHRSTHAISGTFGAAAAAGCTAGLNAQRMRWLLSYTAQQAGGLASWQRDTDHIEKSFDFGGMGARNGVTCGRCCKEPDLGSRMDADARPRVTFRQCRTKSPASGRGIRLQETGVRPWPRPFFGVWIAIDRSVFPGATHCPG